MVNKKVVIICTIIALIVVGVAVWYGINELSKEEAPEVATNTQLEVKNELKEENTIIENIIEEENTTQENSTVEENTTSKNEENNTFQGEEETKTEDQESDTNSNEKALNLVKQEWGEDSTVYYTIDNVEGEIYTISVRSKSTTGTLAEYEVDVKKGTVQIK